MEDLNLRSVRESCKLRPEVLGDTLDDAIFAADFGHVIECTAPKVYSDPETFFRNTYPTQSLCKLVKVVFDRLADTKEAGLGIRLSTGYGGGKTHTLIALWHLAHHVKDLSLGTDLLPAPGRPDEVKVAGVDGDKAGTDVWGRHGDVTTHSLWGELAYQLGGPKAYQKISKYDNPEKVPDSALIRDILGSDSPVLILLDELALYMLKLPEQARKALLSFINNLLSEITARRQAVLVITDPGQQAATQSESRDLQQALKNSESVQGLEDILGRKMTDFDPIGRESAQVIIRRLFESIDETAANKACAIYNKAYKQILQEHPGVLPEEAASTEYAHRIRECYPFHPRLLDTARNRLSAIQDFQRSRGVLRLFARILRDVWESKKDLPIICAGDINWASDSIRTDLLSRLNKDQFAAAADADVIRHAGELDSKYSSDIHRRVASALLLESLAPNGSMDKRDITLATLRPDEVGYEPGEAIDRLMSVCWHIYRKDSTDVFYFHYEPNPNKLIEETIGTIPWDDAKKRALAFVQEYFNGTCFELVAYPAQPRDVSDSSKLKLILADSEELAQRVCDYQNDSDPEAKMPRRFRNAIFGVAPSKDELEIAINEYRRLMAAEKVQQDYKSKKEIKRQIEDIMPSLTRRARLSACRAFNRVVFPNRPPVTLEEKYMVSEEGGLQKQEGQKNLLRFLEDAKLIYKEVDCIDVDLLIKHILPGATPSLEYEGAYPASEIHERALSSEKLRLMMSGAPVRNSIIKAVEEGKLVVRMPNGDVYDSEGLITGPEGARRRDPGRRLSTLRLESDVLVAQRDAPCVKEWTKVDEKPPRDEGVSGEVSVAVAPPQPTIPEMVSASDWHTAIEYARNRPLKSLKFETQKSESAKSLISLSRHFGAKSIKLGVRVLGALKDGGTVSFLVEEAKPTCSIDPLGTAEKLMRALMDGGDYLAWVDLEFGPEGELGKESAFENARKEAESNVDLRAEFGKEM